VTRGGPLAECELLPAIGDYRRVSDTQDTSPAGKNTAPPESPSGAAGSSAVKPVIPAAAAKRANASVIGMLVALVLSIAAFLPVVLMNPAPKSEGFRPDIDVPGIARNAEGVAGFTPIAPEPGETFRPNYARWESGVADGVPTWEVGYITPKEAFIGLTQTNSANPTWLLQETKNAPVTGKRSAGGQDWELRDAGQGDKSLVLAYRGSTVVLTGSAQLDEFSVLAAAVVKSLESNASATNSASPSTSP
jgi:hypothetical protein